MAIYEVHIGKIDWVEIGKNIDRRNTTLTKEQLLDVIDGLIVAYEHTKHQLDNEKANYRRCGAELQKYKKINASLIAKEIPEEVIAKVVENFVDLIYERWD